MNAAYIDIDSRGRATIAPTAPPTAPRPCLSYSAKPVQLALRHGLMLEMHGRQFRAAAALDLEDALSLISMLSYLIRDQIRAETNIRAQTGCVGLKRQH